MDGIIVIDKKDGITSRDVVNEACKILNTKKIGHNGTLDPFATGVLVLCIGKYTKLVELITSYDKVYEATVVLGVETDTLDYTGNITKTKDTHILKEDIANALNEMQKTYYQEAPIYSAIKINGKKLYEYARNNEDVNLPKREVTIKKLELISDITYEDNKTIFKIRCEVSKGTYIRSLVRDLAYLLNTYGMLRTLRRTKQGMFDISDSSSLDDLKNGNYKLYDMNKVFENYNKEIVNEYIENKIKNGSILENRNYKLPILFLNKDNIPLAVYKEYEKDENKIKPWKML